MTSQEPTRPGYAETNRQSAELHALRRMLDLSRGCFSLSVAVCNSPALRDYLIAQIRATDPSVEVAVCPPQSTDIFGFVRGSVHNAARTALFVTGLEDSVPSADSHHAALRSLNASRELWEQAYPCPVVFWVADYVAALLASAAPDWWRYRSHRFEFVSEQATVQSAVLDRFAGDIGSAASLSADEKRFRIAELEERINQVPIDAQPELREHVRAWLNELAFLRWFIGDQQSALRTLDNALALAREVGDRRGEGNALGNLGLAYAAVGEPRRAIEFYEHALRIAREIGDRRGEGNALGNLGLAYAALDEPRRAIEFYEQHSKIAREIGDRRGEGRTLGNLGIAYKNLGEPRRAIEFHEQTLGIAREIGDRRGESNALGNLGNAYAALGEPRRAIEFHEQHLKLAREIGDRQGESIASWNLGLQYEAAGNLARAVELMQVCVDYERELGHPDAERYAAYVAALRARLPASS